MKGTTLRRHPSVENTNISRSLVDVVASNDGLHCVGLFAHDLVGELRAPLTTVGVAIS